MSRVLEIHPNNPQPRLIQQAVQLLQRGEVLAVPTDSSYALVCQLDDKNAVDTLRRIRRVDDKHLLTLLCRDLSEVSHYARVDNRQYRLLKQATPGPFTFVLDASKEVPRRVSHASRKTIGLRVPQHLTLQALLEAHGSALLATTLFQPEPDEDDDIPALPLHDVSDVTELLDQQVAAVIDSGTCPNQPTTVVDLTPMVNGGAPELIRVGAGDPALVGL